MGTALGRRFQSGAGGLKMKQENELLPLLGGISSPSYVVDEEAMLSNLKILKGVSDRTGCRILLAQKCFSMFPLYPLIGEYLHGTTASGLFEAKLAKEHMKGENHVFSAAYREEEMNEILEICDHIVFNSFSQWTRYRDKALASGKTCGIRINPECSTQEGHDIYDPCAPYSRLGVTKENFRQDLLEGISGLHFHTLCEQDSDALKTTLKAVEESFGEYLHQMEWINLGGGHHITRPGYDLATLEECIRHLQETYQLRVYLEPGEAVAYQAGYLVSEVLDIIKNGMEILILDASAACHMPDVLEMPYRPDIIGSGMPGEKTFTYRLGGPTCLSGDIIGDYSFDQPVRVGERLIFLDMAIYTMVKNNTFNGMNLPSIYRLNKQGIELVKAFGYEDFKGRLG